jgi:hypothetical protein
MLYYAIWPLLESQGSSAVQIFPIHPNAFGAGRDLV